MSQKYEEVEPFPRPQTNYVNLSIMFPPALQRNKIISRRGDYVLIQQRKGWRADYIIIHSYVFLYIKLPWKTTGLVRVYIIIQSPRSCSLICTGASWASWGWSWQFWTLCTKRYSAWDKGWRCWRWQYKEMKDPHTLSAALGKKIHSLSKPLFSEMWS